MILIGLGHKARQGKDILTTAIIRAALQYPVVTAQRFSFATTLKVYCRNNHEVLSTVYRAVTGKSLATPKDDELYGYTDILQWVGTDIMRKLDPDYWIKQVDIMMKAHSPDVAVISDVRFPNEAEYVKSKGGILVRVVRTNTDGSQYFDPGRDPKHVSETALDNYTGWDEDVVAVSGDIAGLRTMGETLTKRILDKLL